MQNRGAEVSEMDDNVMVKVTEAFISKVTEGSGHIDTLDSTLDVLNEAITYSEQLDSRTVSRLQDKIENAKGVSCDKTTKMELIQVLQTLLLCKIVSFGKRIYLPKNNRGQMEGASGEQLSTTRLTMQRTCNGDDITITRDISPTKNKTVGKDNGHHRTKVTTEDIPISLLSPGENCNRGVYGEEGSNCKSSSKKVSPIVEDHGGQRVQYPKKQTGGSSSVLPFNTMVPGTSLHVRRTEDQLGAALNMYQRDSSQGVTIQYMGTINKFTSAQSMMVGEGGDHGGPHGDNREWKSSTCPEQQCDDVEPSSIGQACHGEIVRWGTKVYTQVSPRTNSRFVRYLVGCQDMKKICCPVRILRTGVPCGAEAERIVYVDTQDDSQHTTTTGTCINSSVIDEANPDESHVVNRILQLWQSKRYIVYTTCKRHCSVKKKEHFSIRVLHKKTSVGNFTSILRNSGLLVDSAEVQTLSIEQGVLSPQDWVAFGKQYTVSRFCPTLVINQPETWGISSARDSFTHVDKPTWRSIWDARAITSNPTTKEVNTSFMCTPTRLQWCSIEMDTQSNPETIPVGTLEYAINVIVNVPNPSKLPRSFREGGAVCWVCPEISINTLFRVLGLGLDYILHACRGVQLEVSHTLASNHTVFEEVGDVAHQDVIDRMRVHFRMRQTEQHHREHLTHHQSQTGDKGGNDNISPGLKPMSDYDLFQLVHHWITTCPHSPRPPPLPPKPTTVAPEGQYCRTDGSDSKASTHEDGHRDILCMTTGEEGFCPYPLPITYGWMEKLMMDRTSSTNSQTLEGDQYTPSAPKTRVTFVEDMVDVRCMIGFVIEEAVHKLHAGWKQSEKETKSQGGVQEECKTGTSPMSELQNTINVLYSLIASNISLQFTDISLVTHGDSSESKAHEEANSAKFVPRAPVTTGGGNLDMALSDIRARFFDRETPGAFTTCHYLWCIFGLKASYRPWRYKENHDETCSSSRHVLREQDMSCKGIDRYGGGQECHSNFIYKTTDTKRRGRPPNSHSDTVTAASVNQGGQKKVKKMKMKSAKQRKRGEIE